MVPATHLETPHYPPRKLVLASSSSSRHALLERLGIPFTVAVPDVDEQRRAGETPKDLVRRLSEAKARAVAPLFPRGLIIGSDQVAWTGEAILTKPGNRARAVEQLKHVAGRSVCFYTGLCLLDAALGQAWVECVPFQVHFRPLTQFQIESYVDREKPWDCAGSFKSEGLGIALFQRLEGDDPTALIGLPLIRLVAMLANAGLEVLGEAATPGPGLRPVT